MLNILKKSKPHCTNQKKTGYGAMTSPHSALPYRSKLTEGSFRNFLAKNYFSHSTAEIHD